jgi:molybdate transport system substrate-binding protein
MMVVSGAGYKALVTDIAAVCRRDFRLNMQISYGNYGQMLAQIKNTGMIQAVISSDNFFADYGVATSNVYPIGKGMLVLAWRQGLHLHEPQDIDHPEIRRLAIPQIQKALYGRAGMAFLRHSHLDKRVEDKLFVVSTVPQVTSYLVAGEVDAGFINLTDVLKVKDKIGGYMTIATGYPPIHIVAGALQGQSHGNEKSLSLFQQCMMSGKIREIARKHGLWTTMVYGQLWFMDNYGL